MDSNVKYFLKGILIIMIGTVIGIICFRRELMTAGEFYATVPANDIIRSINNDTLANGSRILHYKVFSSKPPPEYQSNYKNPCWLEMSASPGRPTVQCVPYFLLLGMPKCATTDLYAWLARHPLVANKHVKEPRFWTKGDHRWDIHDYVKTFDKSIDYIQRYVVQRDDIRDFHPIVMGEATPNTLFASPQWWRDPVNAGLSEPKVLTAHSIHHVMPDVKLLVILRDPVQRLYSDYLYFTEGVEKSPAIFHQGVLQSVGLFKECLTKHPLRYCAYTGYGLYSVRLYIGLYSVFLRDWFDIYPRSSFLIVRTETYAVDRYTALDQISRFLDLGPYPWHIYKKLGSRNPRNTRRKEDRKIPDMFNETRTLLEEFYRPYSQDLATVLNRTEFRWNS